MKLCIFGVGKCWKNRKYYFDASINKDKIVAFIDNRADVIDNVDGYPVYKPEVIVKLDYDIIILMSQHYGEMKQQVLKLGVSKDRIFSWEKYYCSKIHGKLQLFVGNVICKGPRILIIVQNLGYSGSSLASVYAAESLKMLGYEVLLAAKKGDDKFIKEILQKKINVLLCPSFPFIAKEELFWIQRFDFVIVNVFPMIYAAYVISKYKPVLWWLHEAKEAYLDVIEEFDECIKDDDWLKRINILGVSNIAKRNFNRVFPYSRLEIMEYGIPDEYSVVLNSALHNTLVFAVIGDVRKLKAQDMFLESILQLSEAERSKAGFWIIGFCGENRYSTEIQKLAATIPRVKMLGELTRRQMQEIFPQIDVVVCPSLEDSMPIVVTEGMMYRKPCIISDSVGQAQYIQDGENGFVCSTGDAKALAEKMRWCINNREALGTIGQRARKVYEECFSMEKFGERLEKALLQTEKKWNEMQEKRV